MAFNTRHILTDAEGNPIPQYFNPDTDSFEPLTGIGGSNKIVVYNSNGSEVNVSLQPILDLLSQLTGTVIDEQTREQNELQRIQLYNEIKTAYDNGEFVGEKGDTGNGLEFQWQGTNLGVRVQGQLEYIYVDLQGPAGNNGKGLEYVWDGTSLGVRLEGQTEYSFVNLVGPDGPEGPRGLQGDDGPAGKNLEFSWDGTKLGVRVEGTIDYTYVDLQGPAGNIDNLNKSHVTTALGYIPVRSVNSSLPDEDGNLTITVGSKDIFYDNDIRESYLPNDSLIKQGITITTIITGGSAFPSILEAGTVITYKTINNYVVQDYTTVTGVKYTRRGRATIWDAWSKQATEGYVDGKVSVMSDEFTGIIGQLFNDVGTKVNKSGDTMTGDLTMVGKELLIRMPESTGGWARGLGFRNVTGSTLLGSFGFAGNADIFEYMYAGYGATPWGVDANFLFHENKTQAKKPLEEVFTAISIGSQQEFDDTLNSISDSMPNNTYYKRVLGLTTAIPNPMNVGGTWMLDGHKTSSLYQWQKLISYIGNNMYFRTCSNGTWSNWSQIVTTRGNVDFSWNALRRPMLEEYEENSEIIGSSFTTLNLSNGYLNNLTIDLSDKASITINGEIGTRNRKRPITIYITQPSTAKPVLFQNIIWRDGQIPDLTTPNKMYIVTLAPPFEVSKTKMYGIFGGMFDVS